VHRKVRFFSHYWKGLQTQASHFQEDRSMKSCIVTTLFRAAIPFMLAVSMLESAAMAGELAGATLPDTLKSGDLTLKLNGVSLRKKSMFKVYVGGL